MFFKRHTVVDRLLILRVRCRLKCGRVRGARRFWARVNIDREQTIFRVCLASGSRCSNLTLAGSSEVLKRCAFMIHWDQDQYRIKGSPLPHLAMVSYFRMKRVLVLNIHVFMKYTRWIRTIFVEMVKVTAILELKFRIPPTEVVTVVIQFGFPRFTLPVWH